MFGLLIIMLWKYFSEKILKEFNLLLSMAYNYDIYV